MKANSFARLICVSFGGQRALQEKQKNQLQEICISPSTHSVNRKSQQPPRSYAFIAHCLFAAFTPPDQRTTELPFYGLKISAI